MKSVKRWWHRMRFRTCIVCGDEYPRAGSHGHGIGLSFCSGECYGLAWVEFLKGPAEMDRQLEVLREKRRAAA